MRKLSWEPQLYLFGVVQRHCGKYRVSCLCENPQQYEDTIRLCVDDEQPQRYFSGVMNKPGQPGYRERHIRRGGQVRHVIENIRGEDRRKEGQDLLSAIIGIE